MSTGTGPTNIFRNTDTKNKFFTILGANRIACGTFSRER